MRKKKKKYSYQQYNLSQKKPRFETTFLFWSKVCFFFSLSIFLLLLPPFLKEGIFSGHDIITHSVYLHQFSNAFSTGQFPVRWIDWFTPGFNHPLFNFYQPGFYYLFLFLKFIGLSFSATLSFLSLLLWIGSGVLTYLFAKRHMEMTAAVATSALYIFAPYHILDLFVRGALPEFTALAFIPGIFWGIKWFFDTKSLTALGVTSLFIALVIVSHPPTLFMFSFLIGGYILLLSWQKKSLRFLFFVGLSGILGLLLSSFFLLPTFVEQPFVQPIFLQSGYYDFHTHFACVEQLILPTWNYGISEPGCRDAMSYQLGLVHWGIILFCIYILFVKPIRTFWGKTTHIAEISLPNYPFITLFFFMCLFALYFTLSFSQPIWETIPFFSYIQYPWRFLSVAIFTCSLLGGFILGGLKNRSQQFAYAGVIILLIGTVYGWYLHPAKYLTENDIRVGTLIPEMGYMPKWARIFPNSVDTPKNELRILSGDVTIENIELRPTKKQYKVTVSKQGRIRLYTHYFPGWQIQVDGKKHPFIYDNMYGYIDITLPPGYHEINLAFGDTPIRTAGNALSVIGIIIVTILLGGGFLRKLFILWFQRSTNQT